MRKIITTLAALAALIGSAVAQTPNFPQTLPANTVVGRLGIGPGPSQAIPFATLSAQLFSLYPRTAAEITAGVTPTNYTYPPLYLLRYGATCDGTDQHVQIQNALNVAAVNGGVVEAPTSTYPAGCNIGTTGITLADKVRFNGVGRNATFFSYSGTGNAVDITGTGGGLSNLYILTTNVAGNCIRVRGLWREENLDSVVCDGSTASPTANNVGKALLLTALDADNATSLNITINRFTSYNYKYGIDVTSGTVQTVTSIVCNQTYLIGRSAGVIAGSVGIRFGANVNGVGSTCQGGTIESYAIPIQTAAGSIGISWNGDVEGNTTNKPSYGTGAQVSFFGMADGYRLDISSNGTANRWMQREQNNGIQTFESYYDQRSVIYEGSSASQGWYWNRGASLIDGGSPTTIGEIVTNSATDATGVNTWFGLRGHLLQWGGGTEKPSGTCSTGDLWIDRTASAGGSAGSVVTTAGTCGVDAVQSHLAFLTTQYNLLFFNAVSAPSTPSSGIGSAFLDSTTKTLRLKNDAGVLSTTVIADTGASNNFLTAISAGGVISKAQPAFSNLSGQITLAQEPTLGANTVLANVTGGSAVPTAAALPSGGTSGCSAATNAANYTAGTGWGCNTSITAAAVPVGGITGLGTGVATALAVNVGSAGAFVTFNGALGTPSSGTLTSATGLPISTGLTGAGTGVLTALSVNVGTAGSVIVNGGALGSPSSAGTLPAHTLGGTISGGGNQINNVVIGTTTPLAGAFTTLSATGHTTFEGITSTGATGTGKFVYDTTPSFTGTITANTSVDGDGFKILTSAGTQSPAFNLSTANANAAARNWSITTNFILFGDFAIRSSDAQGGNPYTAGTTRFNITPGGGVIIGTSALNAVGGSLGLNTITASGTAPGAAGLKLEVVCGTGAGSAKIIAIAGTSATPVTVLDNIGSGVTGC